MKKVIITGITGQDGSYLAELLLKKGYDVYGFVRRESFESLDKRHTNISKILDRITLVPVSITDPLNVYKNIFEIKPDEIYHLAAYSFVSYEMTDVINILNVNFNSTAYILSSILDINPDCKIFFAGSSEMFGNPNEFPQNESSKFNPKSIYGIAKIASYFLLKNYREKKGLFACTGIMYNHESSRRNNQFVTKKIVSAAVKIKCGYTNVLELGNLDAKRDWGYAPDYVNAMWTILQQDKADDYILATGKLHSVREFVDYVFSALNLNYKKYVKLNKKYYRVGEEIPLCGDSTKLRQIGWKQTKSFDEIIEEMIQDEMSKVY